MSTTPRETEQTTTREPRWGESVVRVTTTVGIVAFAFAAVWFVVNLLYALL